MTRLDRSCIRAARASASVRVARARIRAGRPRVRAQFVLAAEVRVLAAVCARREQPLGARAQPRLGRLVAPKARRPRLLPTARARSRDAHQHHRGLGDRTRSRDAHQRHRGLDHGTRSRDAHQLHTEGSITGRASRDAHGHATVDGGLSEDKHQRDSRLVCRVRASRSRAVSCPSRCCERLA
jgi:hypothetical protein